MTPKTAGTGPGERHLNGEQTTGRDYINLSAAEFAMRRTDNLGIAVRDGTVLMADLHQPDAPGRFPALLSFSPYPRQIQDVGAPLGFIEAGASDFFVPRGYVHLIANARGTGGSGGTWTLLDGQEREDIHDLIEWLAAQPWCDGNIGMLGVSYFAMAQLAAAVTQPPHLKAIAPLLTTDDLYGVVRHNGLLSSGFISAWLPAVGVLAQRPDAFWRGLRVDLARDLLHIPAIHARMQHLNGESIVTVLKDVIHAHYPEHPFGDLWRAMAVDHPLRDEFWDARNVRPLLANIDIPVYLGADWDNGPMHLPSTFTAWEGLRGNPNLRVALLQPGGFSWPWEALHVEVLAWYDHWLKGRETGIMDGPPIRWQMPGTDGWRESPDWPPPEAVMTPFALRTDGGLGAAEAAPGQRAYLFLPPGSGEPANANPPVLPDRLTWQTAPFAEPVEFAGNIELALDASATAPDIGWIAVLYDVPPRGEPEPITAGWLRASLSTVDAANSRLGAPDLPCRVAESLRPGEQRSYRIPVVPNARHLPAGHALRLVLASSDEADKTPTLLGFTHTPVREASLNGVMNTSRLWLPLLPDRGAP